MLQYEMTSIVREEIGFNELFASQIADAIIRGMRVKLGGMQIYIAAPSKAERNASIRKDFTGNNRDEICRKYEISRTQFYEIIGARTK